MRQQTMGSLVTTVLTLVLFLPSWSLPAAHGQAEDKDAVIKMLKEKIDQQQKEFDRKVKELERRHETTDALIRKAIKGLKDTALELERAKQEQKDLAAESAVKEAAYKEKIANLQAALADKAVTAAEAKKLTARLLNEIDLLKTTVKDRETAIVAHEAKAKELRNLAVQFEAQAIARTRQNEALLEKVLELIKVIAKMEADRPAPPRLNLMPPEGAMTGKIEKVEGPLVQINLGADNGLKVNNTLEVYRLQPKAEYLGTIRILDVKARESVGRLVAPKGPNAPALKVGDQVTSKLVK